LAATPWDCARLLEDLGISPLEGWDINKALNEDDYTVLIAKAFGKEKVVHTKAVEVCQKNIKIINQRWQEAEKENKGILLEELLNNKDYFPAGPPKCPYGVRYQDKDNDHTVDVHYHPAKNLSRTMSSQ